MRVNYLAVASALAICVGVAAFGSAVEAKRHVGPRVAHIHHKYTKVSPAYGAYGYSREYRYVPADAYGAVVNYNGPVDFGACARNYGGTDSLCNRQNGSLN